MAQRKPPTGNASTSVALWETVEGAGLLALATPPIAARQIGNLALHAPTQGHRFDDFHIRAEAAQPAEQQFGLGHGGGATSLNLN